MTRWLRHRKDGTIYEWNTYLARNILCEEVTEEEAFPEKFLPEKQKGRKSKIILETLEVPDEEKVDPETDPAAQKGLPKK